MTATETATPELLPLGQDGVLVRFSRTASGAATGAVIAFAADLRDDLPDGAVEIVPSLTSVLVRFDPGAIARPALVQLLDRRARARDWLAAPLPTPPRRWSVPATFGGEAGPQLAEFASLAGLSETRAVQEATEADLRVLAIGFTAGLPYLGLLPAHWDVARQAEQTPQVPAGTVAAAGRQQVIFPADSPTGWRRIGRTAFRPFLPSRAEPFLLRAGDALRLVPVSASEMAALEDADGIGGATCEVLS